MNSIQSELSQKYMYANFFSMDAYNNYISSRLLILYGNNNWNSFNFMFRTGATLMALASEQLIKSIFYLKDPYTKLSRHILFEQYMQLNKDFNISNIEMGVKMYVLWQTKYSQDYEMSCDKSLKQKLKRAGVNVDDDSYLKTYSGLAGHISLSEFDDLMYELFSLFKKTLEEVGYDHYLITRTSIFCIKKDQKELVDLLLMMNSKSLDFKKLLNIEE